MGITHLDRVQVTLHDPLIPQGPKLLQLAAANSLAGGRKGLQARLARQLPIQGYQFPHLAVRGVSVRAPDEGQFKRYKDSRLIAPQELPQRGKIMDGRQAQPGCHTAERHQAIGAAQLLG
jgi:hypothetical protein